MTTDETQMGQREYLDKDLTEAIIGAAFEVHNHLGYGFLEVLV